MPDHLCSSFGKVKYSGCRCAELNLIHALAGCNENIYKIGLPVYGAIDEEIGLLSVTVKGINFMKDISFESEMCSSSAKCNFKMLYT
jgi:hypothetical protein